jgi:hypothetical protein
MPKRTDIKSIMIIGAGPQDSHYLFERFTEIMGGAK